MSEPAGIWLRVSSTGQDEQNQHPECLRWCESHEYDVAGTYTIKGKSAFKGNRKFDETWAHVIDDMHQGKIKVLVVWKQDRIDRKLETFQMLAEVVKAGGRVEFVTQPHLNDLTTMGGRIALKVQEEIAYAESKDKSDRIKINHAGKRAKGSVVGRAPWGYKIAPGRNASGEPVKVFVPTPEGRKYVPQVFERVINGQSLRKVAEWLTAEGAGGKCWHEGYIGARFINNPVYFGQRRNAGQLVTEALVSYSTWQQANAAVASRVRHGRGTSKHEKPLVAPICGACYRQEREGCPSGISPMFRIFGGAGAGRRAYFRCFGHGPQRKGCGAPLVPEADLDAEVIASMLEDPNYHFARVFVPGDDRSDEIGKLRQAAMNAYLRGEREEFARLDAEAEKLEREPATVAHWEERYTCETCGQVADITRCVVLGHHIKTRGEHFGSLDTDERREELRQNWIIFAEKDSAVILPRHWP